MINVTLPDEKQNYIHRIGRVGRAERWVLRFPQVKLLYVICMMNNNNNNNNVFI